MFLRRRQRRQYKLSDTDSADRRLRLSNADDGGVLCKCVCVCMCVCVSRPREDDVTRARAGACTGHQSRQCSVLLLFLFFF